MVNSMKNRFIPLAMFCVLPIATLCHAQSASPAKAFTNGEITSILRNRVDRARTNQGIVVGVIDASGARVIAYGQPERGSRQTLDGDSIFEIGSLTKLLTDALMVEMSARGEAAMTDPVAKYLPATVKRQALNGKEITLLHLASHTSGLPREPDNLLQSDCIADDRAYSIDRLYTFLNGFEFQRGIGSRTEYSNLGVSILGHALALRAGMDYDDLLRRRVTGPLGMSATGVSLASNLENRIAKGHSSEGVPMPSRINAWLPGAGGLHSSVNDLLKFLAANLDLSPTPLNALLVTMQQPIHNASYYLPCIGWNVDRSFDRELYWRTGGTLGYSSFLGFDKQSKRGVVILSNSRNEVDDIGMHLLASGEHPLKNFPPATTRKAIPQHPADFDAYAGTYPITPWLRLLIHREGDHLFAQVDEADAFELLATTPTDYFAEGIEAQLTFVKDPSGRVTQLVMRGRNGVMSLDKVP